jgi:hypothetical protein
MNNTVPVYHKDGTQLMNTTPTRARKLIKNKQARPFFKDNIFCIQLLDETRKERG